VGQGGSVADRGDFGKAARKRMPRRAIGDYHPAHHRADPVSIIEAQEVGRVEELLPLRHQRMGASPFAFLRGAAAVMAADLGSRPSTGVHVWSCGDAHLANLGIFAGPDRSLLFDINDFDETAPGSFEWDVLRLGTSFQVAAQEAGLAKSSARSLPGIMASAYRDAITHFAAMTELDVWYYRLDSSQMEAWAQQADSAQATKALRRTEAEARARDGWSAVRKLTHIENGRRVFNNDPPLLVSFGLEHANWRIVQQMFDDYRSSLAPDRQMLLNRYRLIDIGHKVVGVGSVGLLAWVILLQGRDDNDLLVLQVKQAVNSVLQPLTDLPVPEPHGRRVVTGQVLMQAASDAFLGHVTGSKGRSFYVRQLRDMKWSPDLAAMNQAGYRAYAQLCGLALARAHSRAGDPVAISGYLGASDAFPDAVAAFANAYAKQNLEDYRKFTEAIRSGRLAASTEDAGLQLKIQPDGSVTLGTPAK
jgi:uncharacterized protein (DUF2252 family)